MATSIPISTFASIRPGEWERIYDNFEDGIYITNSQGMTLWLNRAYETIMGISRDQVIGRYMDDIVEEGLLSTSVTKKVIETGGVVTSEQQANTGKNVIVRGTPILKDDEIILVVSFVRDITSLKRLQDEVDKNLTIVKRYQNRLQLIAENEDFVAESKPFRDAVDLAQRIAQVDSTVLITGESGTGKEVLAREIHNRSPRRDKPLLSVNCGAIPEQLLESELFGYEAGSFTGASKKGHVGLFEAASSGTLVLDEIGDMPLHLQVKLLRVLQEQTITRIGSTQSIPIDTRIISSTNKDLAALVKEGKFREDLYYRLNIVVISTPPLRKRKEDIPGLIQFFSKRINERYHLNKTFSPELVNELLNYDWPGNVRELENMIERILVISTSDIISVQDANLPWHTNNLSGFSSSQAPLHLPPTQQFKTLKEAFEYVEEQMLRDAKTRLSTTYEIAKELGISQPSASRKLNKYGIN